MVPRSAQKGTSAGFPATAHSLGHRSLFGTARVLASSTPVSLVEHLNVGSKGAAFVAMRYPSLPAPRACCTQTTDNLSSTIVQLRPNDRWRNASNRMMLPAIAALSDSLP